MNVRRRVYGSKVSMVGEKGIIFSAGVNSDGTKGLLIFYGLDVVSFYSISDLVSGVSTGWSDSTYAWVCSIGSDMEHNLYVAIHNNTENEDVCIKYEFVESGYRLINPQLITSSANDLIILSNKYEVICGTYSNIYGSMSIFGDSLGGSTVYLDKYMLDWSHGSETLNIRNSSTGVETSHELIRGGGSAYLSNYYLARSTSAYTDILFLIYYSSGYSKFFVQVCNVDLSTVSNGDSLPLTHYEFKYTKVNGEDPYTIGYAGINMDDNYIYVPFGVNDYNKYRIMRIKRDFSSADYLPSNSLFSDPGSTSSSYTNAGIATDGYSLLLSANSTNDTLNNIGRKSLISGISDSSFSSISNYRLTNELHVPIWRDIRNY